MAHSDTFDRMVRHIGEYLETDASHLTPDSRLSSALPGLDSLKLVEMMLYLEDSFKIEMEESAMASIDTLGDLSAYIDGRLADQVPNA